MFTTFRVETVSANRLDLAAGLLMVAGLTGCVGESEAANDPQPTPATGSASLLSMPVASSSDDGSHPFKPGTYLIPKSSWAIADFTVTFPEDWTVQYGHVYATRDDEGGDYGFYAVAVDEIFADACRGEGGRTQTVGPEVDDLVSALLEQRGGAWKSDPVSTTLGGFPATRVDLRIPSKVDLDRCQLAEYGYTGLQVWYSERPDKYFVLLPAAVARVYVVDVDGQRQVFLTQTDRDVSAEGRTELQAVLDSIHIEG
jgi:hypothetical protein